jgi:hypothetical protein
MTFQWPHYLNVADFLFQQASTCQTFEEGMLRASISRAYYAALGLARDYVFTKKKLDRIPDGVDGSHEWVIEHFSPTSTFPDTMVYGHLKRLRDRRRIVDYESESKWLGEKLRKQVELSLSESNETITQLQKQFGST